MSTRWTALLIVALTIAHGDAHAQTVEQQAEARARYERALVLLREHSFEEACDLLEESLELAVDMTTAFRLGECYQELGKLGLAWRYYTEVAEAAGSAGMSERRDFAGFRAAALADRLARLRVNVPTELVGLADLTIQLDGRKLPPALWNLDLRVDPGPHELSASAPAYESWSAEVNVPSVQDSAEVTVVMRRKPPEKDSSIPPSSVGIALTSIGVAGMVTGIVVGVTAKSTYEDSLEQCIGDSCTAEALEMQDDAVIRGNVGTVVFSIGAAATAAGITLWLVSELAGDSEVDVGLTGRGVCLRGRF